MNRLRATLLKGLIDEGVAMVQRGDDAGAQLAALEAGDASPEELEQRLHGVTRGGRYRAAAMDPERLATLVRNPAAPARTRIAAAIALRETTGGRAQLRVAAEVSEEPEVRDALESLAEEEADPVRDRELLRRLAEG